uniref:Uncharacterized protein n=1 Tax=Arundo donax TaxID=35708 RepID=A0A0A9G2M3_ARUDO
MKCSDDIGERFILGFIVLTLVAGTLLVLIFSSAYLSPSGVIPKKLRCAGY